MYVLLYLIFTFVRFARGNKVTKKFAHVKEKYILQFIHWIYYNVSGMVQCETMQK